MTDDLPFTRRSRFSEVQAVLLATAGPMLSAEEVAESLGLSPEEVEARRQSNELFALQVGTAWRYPEFQLAGDKVLPGLPAVLSQLAPDGPWVTLDILLAHDTALSGRNLLEVQQNGDYELVDRVMRLLASDGYS